MNAIRAHYERVIVACCFFILFANVGLPSTSFNVYQPYLVQMSGVGDAGASLVVSVRTLTSFLCMFAVMPYYHFIPVRLGVLVATLLTACGFFLFSTASNLTGLCAASVLTGAGYGFGGMVATTLVIGNWFYGHVGTAAGIAAVGSGVASMVMPLVLAPLIEQVSLHDAFLLEAVLALILAGVVFALLRSKPSDMGLKPVEAKARSTKKRPTTFAPSGLPKAQRYLMELAMILLGAVAIVGMNYLSVLFVSDGVPSLTAAALISLCGAALTVSKLVTGLAFDRFGTLAATVFFFGVLLIGLILCCFAGMGSLPVSGAAALLYGAGISLGTVGISVWSLELCTPQESLRTIRNFQLGYAFGGFAFNMMPGAIVHAGGSYTTSYVVLSVLCAVCAIIVIGVYIRRRKAASR